MFLQARKDQIVRFTTQETTTAAAHKVLNGIFLSLGLLFFVNFVSLLIKGKANSLFMAQFYLPYCGHCYHQVSCRPVVSRGAGDALAPPEFGSSVNPIPTRGGRLCPAHYC